MQLGREGRDEFGGEDVDDVFVLSGHGVGFRLAVLRRDFSDVGGVDGTFAGCSNGVDRRDEQ